MKALTRLFAVVFFFGNVCNVLAQEPELVTFADLTFVSDFEKQSFTSLNGQADPLALLLGPDSDKGGNLQKAQTLLTSIENALRNPVSKKKSLEKKIEIIQDYLHKRHLKRYQLVANFQELLANGTFNCVTAVALYALTFERLGIDYQIYEQPNHVYLVAEDETTVLIEATLATDGLFVPNEQFQKKMVNYLRQSKILIDDELDGQDLSNIYEAIDLADLKIDLRQLAGLQYMNDALLEIEANDLGAAMQQYQKAYLLYPKENCNMMLFTVALLQFSAAGSDAKLALHTSINAYALQPAILDLAALRTEIKRSMENFLKDQHTLEDLAYVLSELSRLDDQELEKEAKYIYHNWHTNDAHGFNRYDLAYPHALAAYQLFPDRVYAQGIFADIRVKRLTMYGNPQLILDSLAFDEAKYPFFKEIDFVHYIRYIAYGEIARAKFAADERTLAISYLGKMDSLDAVRPVTKKDVGVEMVYPAAVNSFVRSANYKKARFYLLKGLELAPYSEKLNSYKRMYKNELNLK